MIHSLPFLHDFWLHGFDNYYLSQLSATFFHPKKPPGERLKAPKVA
jgi:hypothetical protein